MVEQPLPFFNRVKAAGLHLLFSVLLAIPVIYLVFQIWYPAPLQKATGAGNIMLLVLLAQLCIAPLLTLLIYKRHRIKLIFDLLVIGLIQLAALAYGVFTLAEGRPAWLVFVVDDFELVSPASLHPRQQQNFELTSWFQRPQFMVAAYSEDTKTRQQQKEDEMFAGISLATRPETYQSVEPHYPKMLERSKALEQLNDFNTAPQISSALKHWPQAETWLPLKAPRQDMVVLLDKKGTPLTVANLNPWN